VQTQTFKANCKSAYNVAASKICRETPAAFLPFPAGVNGSSGHQRSQFVKVRAALTQRHQLKIKNGLATEPKLDPIGLSRLFFAVTAHGEKGLGTAAV
jgi:hypothetical protein